MAQMDTIYYLIFLLNFIGYSSNYVNAHEDILKTTIVDENNKDIELTWVKSQRSFLANQNLPIRPVYLNKFSRLRKVFRKTFNFVAYHDLDKFSAVIYIEDQKCLTGVVDTRYYIECLPVYLLNEKHHVVEENEVGYIFHYNFVSTFQKEPNKISNLNSPPSESNSIPSYDPNSLNVDYDETFLESQSNFDLPKLIDADLDRILSALPNSESSSTNFASPDISPILSHNSEPFFMNQKETSSYHQPDLDFSILTNTVNERNSPSTSCMSSPANKKRRFQKRSNEKELDTLYPEILVFVSYDMTKLANNYIPWLIYHFIAYFNAVDMLFAQLAKDKINIHLNIAAIVIEMDPHAFNIDLDLRNCNYEESGKSKLDSISQLIKKYPTIFTADTFDFFHLATTTMWTEDVDNRRGLSTEWFSAYSQRIQKPMHKDWKYAGSIVRHGKYVQDYTLAAREIAYLMEIKHDIKTRNLLFNDAQCHGVIQEYNPNCLKWDPKTIEGFKRYLSESRNRCFLLNFPRSLHPYNVPVELISPAKQCSCYYQDVDYSKIIELVAVIPNNCNEELKCFIRNDEGVVKQIEPVPKPLYGTSCGENKVCFARRCLPISLEAIVAK